MQDYKSILSRKNNFINSPLLTRVNLRTWKVAFVWETVVDGAFTVRYLANLELISLYDNLAQMARWSVEKSSSSSESRWKCVPPVLTQQNA